MGPVSNQLKYLSFIYLCVLDEAVSHILHVNLSVFYLKLCSILYTIIFLTLETGISANFDVRRNVVPTLQGEKSPFWKVIHLWCHRTSMPNNLEKSHLVCVLYIFWTFLGKNEKNNQSPHWGRDSGIPSSCPRFATSTTWQASSSIANLGLSDGISSSLLQCGVRFYLSLCPTWSRVPYFTH